MRRWGGPAHSWQIPAGAGLGALGAFFIATAAFGVVRGGHIPEVVDELRDWRDEAANAAGFRITSIAMAGQKELTREIAVVDLRLPDRVSVRLSDEAAAARAEALKAKNPKKKGGAA